MNKEVYFKIFNLIRNSNLLNFHNFIFGSFRPVIQIFADLIGRLKFRFEAMICSPAVNQIPLRSGNKINDPVRIYQEGL